MDLNREIIFAYLEEDNPKKAFFRAYPLLTVSGVITQRFEDDGALRIIPDRNEQFVFKDRMRNIGIWCCIDLTPFPPSANKIRTNKNYSTARGERNQYIVFSDAVHDLADAPFFEVLSGSPKDAGLLSSRAITPRFYIQEGDVLYGPVERRNPAVPKPCQPLTASLVTHLCPDGQTHTILCTQQPAEDAPVPEADARTDGADQIAQDAAVSQVAQADDHPGEEEARDVLPIGETLSILDQQMTPDETIQSLVPVLPAKANLLKPAPVRQESPALAEERQQSPTRLSGTRLESVRTHPVPTPVRDKVQEAVHNKARSSANAEPLVSPVPFSTDLPEVENPVCQAVQLLRSAWRNAANRGQLIRAMSALDGFQENLKRHFLGDSMEDDSLFSITRRQIDALEMERLQTLVSLRQARDNLSAFRREAVSQATGRERAELEALRKEIQQLRETRDALLEEISREEQAAGKPRRVGTTVRWNELLARLKEGFEKAGLPFVEEYARVWLALMADPSSRLAVICSAPEACQQGIESCAASLGWSGEPTGEENNDDPNLAPTLRVTTSAPDALQQSGRTVLVLDNTADVDASTLPMVAMDAAAARSMSPAEDAVYSAGSITEGTDEPAIQKEEAREILLPLFRAASLDDAQLDSAAAFASTATCYLDGNIQSACDWALVLWLIPRLRDAGTRSRMRELLVSYPNACKMLG